MPSVRECCNATTSTTVTTAQSTPSNAATADMSAAPLLNGQSPTKKKGASGGSGKYKAVQMVATV